MRIENNTRLQVGGEEDVGRLSLFGLESAAGSEHIKSDLHLHLSLSILLNLSQQMCSPTQRWYLYSLSLSLFLSPCDSIRLELTYHSSMILSSDPSYLSVCHHLCTSKSLPCSRSHTFRLKELVRLEYGDGKAKSFPLVSSPKLITHEYDRSRLALLCSARHVEKSIIFRGFHTRIMILSLSKMIYLPEWSLSHDFTTSCQQSPR